MHSRHFAAFLEISIIRVLLWSATSSHSQKGWETPRFLPSFSYPDLLVWNAVHLWAFSDVSFSERLACHNTQPRLTSLLTKPARDSQTEEPHTAPDPPVLHLHICPCLQKGHNSVRITNVHLALNIGRTRDCKVKNLMPHGAVEWQFRLIYACIAAALWAPDTPLRNRNHDILPPQKLSHLVTLGNLITSCRVGFQPDKS